MRLRYDLHIHSCLSPCGDDVLTPAFVAGSAKLCGLDVAALTDHNSAKNCPAFFKAAEFYGLSPLGGLELSTVEGVHVLCLFDELEKIMEFDRFVSERLIKMENDPAFFGNQLSTREYKIGGALITSAAAAYEGAAALLCAEEGSVYSALVCKCCFGSRVKMYCNGREGGQNFTYLNIKAKLGQRGAAIDSVGRNGYLLIA